MREIMTEYYIEAKTADQTGKKVAWITSGGPVEPLIVMDVIPVYPENYGAMIGASHMGATSAPRPRPWDTAPTCAPMPGPTSRALWRTAARSAACRSPTCSYAATTYAARS